jgi:hypothetical protein
LTIGQIPPILWNQRSHGISFGSAGTPFLGARREKVVPPAPLEDKQFVQAVNSFGAIEQRGKGIDFGVGDVMDDELMNGGINK